MAKDRSPPSAPPASQPKGSRWSSLTPEDQALWRHVVKDTVPLAGRDLSIQPDLSISPPFSEPPEKPSPTATDKRTLQNGTALPPRRMPLEPTAKSAPLIPGARADVDGRTAERLRRGRLPIERRLDLHGLTQAEAEPRLAQFLSRARHEGLRCVLVITGKGAGREGGVLRQMLPRWLNQAGNRNHVVAFAPAQIEHGGHGAVYVLLKRKRSS